MTVIILQSNIVSMDTTHHLRAARARAGLTQAELAARCGCSQADISKYESGTIPRRLDVVTKLAQSLNIGRDEVIFGPAQPAPAPKRKRA
ncbi:hypothetical protein CEK68_11805 [Xanthomonas sp. LMG 12461]|nr:hypothetical protein CEK68_11805 [Xanthomonas sp. LMG 12461]